MRCHYGPDTKAWCMGVINFSLIQVPGLSDTVGDTVVPVSYGAVGCPIVFQSTATVGYTLAR